MDTASRRPARLGARLLDVPSPVRAARALLALGLSLLAACSAVAPADAGPALEAFSVNIVDAPSGKTLVAFHLSDLVQPAEVEAAMAPSAEAAVRALRVKAIERGAALLDSSARALQGLEPIRYADARGALRGVLGLLTLAFETGLPTFERLVLGDGLKPPLFVAGLDLRLGVTGSTCRTTDGALHRGRFEGGRVVVELCHGQTSMDTVVHELVHGVMGAFLARRQPNAAAFAKTPESEAVVEAIADMMARSAALRLPVVGCSACERIIGAEVKDPARPCGTAGAMTTAASARPDDTACGDRGACVEGHCVARPRFVLDGPAQAHLSDWKPSPECPEPWCHALHRAGLVRRIWLQLDGGWRGPGGQRVPYRGVAVVAYGEERTESGPAARYPTLESLFWAVLAQAPAGLDLAELQKGMLGLAAPVDRDAIQSAFCAVGLPDKDKACKDTDNDDIVASVDNCERWNPNQEDVDSDGVGDACQPSADSDGDGIRNDQDTCPGVPNPGPAQSDLDDDGRGDRCDADMDGDKVQQASTPAEVSRLASLGLTSDNCPTVPNPLQGNMDGDGLGDACDGDRDGDGAADEVDNCPAVRNADQLDSDRDGRGDVCDPDKDGDCIPDATDRCPFFRGCETPAPELCGGCFPAARPGSADPAELPFLEACRTRPGQPALSACPDREAIAHAARATDPSTKACMARRESALRECARCR